MYCVRQGKGRRERGGGRVSLRRHHITPRFLPCPTYNTPSLDMHACAQGLKMKSSASEREQRRLNGAKLILPPLSSELASLVPPLFGLSRNFRQSLAFRNVCETHTGSEV